MIKTHIQQQQNTTQTHKHRNKKMVFVGCHSLFFLKNLFHPLAFITLDFVSLWFAISLKDFISHFIPLCLTVCECSVCLEPALRLIRTSY